MPDLNDDSIYVYRGVPQLFNLKVAMSMERPICFSGKRIDDYVVLDQAKNAIVLNRQGNFSTVENKSTTQGQLKNPSMIIYTEGRIYVSDTGNKRINIYDELGNYEFSFGQKILERPTSISFNGDRLFVCDTVKKEILIFNRKGEYQYSFNSRLENPTAVFSEENTVIVSDKALEEIKIFDRDLTKM